MKFWRFAPSPKTFLATPGKSIIVPSLEYSFDARDCKGLITLTSILWITWHLFSERWGGSCPKWQLSGWQLSGCQLSWVAMS